MKELNKETLDAEIKDGIAVVDFWAPWCGPCKTLGPALEAVVTKAKGAVTMAKVNVDENQRLAQALSQQGLPLQSIPTVVAFVEGRPIDMFQGNIPPSEIEAFVNKAIEAGGGSADGGLGEALEVAEQMLANGSAYKCFSTQEEIAAFRDAAREKGESTLFLSPWRDVPEAEHPDAPYVIRLKAPREGTTVIADKVQGDVTIQNATLDDMILLRADGTPTYMLAVVVDDHDMGVTHVIRGDDHLRNALRQIPIYEAMGWDIPKFAHVSLIHGPDGAKLSKRHGALSTLAYREMGYLPEAMKAYLLRLGWSHGDQEIFTEAEATALFDIEGINKAPARLDLEKLGQINSHFMRATDDARLFDLLLPYLESNGPMSEAETVRIRAAMAGLKDRGTTLPELAEAFAFLRDIRPIQMNKKARKSLSEEGLDRLAGLRDELQQLRQ